MLKGAAFVGPESPAFHRDGVTPAEESGCGVQTQSSAASDGGGIRVAVSEWKLIEGAVQGFGICPATSDES